VLDDGLGPELRRKVERPLLARLALHWVEPPPGTRGGLPLWGRMPATTYCKLLIPDCLPDDTARVLWLDADLVVLEDLGELWHQDLRGHTILAAPDPFVQSVSSRLGVAAWAELGLPRGAAYFNAGVMLVDMARWRRDDVSEKAYRYLRRFRDRVFFHDQEALNAVLANEWGPLDDRWNRSVSAEGLGCADGASAAILHYSGTLKPWQYRWESRHHAIYYKYLDLTEWGGFRPPRSSWGTLLGLYQSSALRKVVQPLEQRWFRNSLERTRRTVGDDDA
jgi:lipopolysaccharide biosynthesis glycosyltransferase